MWAWMRDACWPSVRVAVIPFVWMLSSGWEEADLFKKSPPTYA
jgi:hypothetical protein